MTTLVPPLSRATIRKDLATAARAYVRALDRRKAAVRKLVQADHDLRDARRHFQAVTEMLGAETPSDTFANLPEDQAFSSPS